MLILGSSQEAEDLKRSTRRSLEAIGQELAVSCRDRSYQRPQDNPWLQACLVCNQDQLARAQEIQAILFTP